MLILRILLQGGIDQGREDRSQHIKKWLHPAFEKFDIGLLKNTDSIEFFMESFGVGCFPELMRTMKAIDKKEKISAKEELQLALEVFYEVVLAAKAVNARLQQRISNIMETTL